MQTDVYYSPLDKISIINILTEQIDEIPSLFRCIISFNAARYVGSSKVCGTTAGIFFELRNRKDPYFSLRAQGTLHAQESGTIIDIKWVKPKIPDVFGVLLLRRYSNDKDTILNFLRQWLNISQSTGRSNS